MGREEKKRHTNILIFDLYSILRTFIVSWQDIYRFQSYRESVSFLNYTYIILRRIGVHEEGVCVE
jgi:hypothetical protein